MLNSEQTMLALNDVKDRHLESAAAMLGYMKAGRRKRRDAERLWRLALIAALFTALLAACAVGYSIHQRRQQELREKNQVDEKHVDAWVDFDVPALDQTGTAEEPVVTLLSAYNDGVFCTVYLDVSPVEESELILPFEQDAQEDGWYHWMEYCFTVQGGEERYYARLAWDGEGEYGPEDYRSEESAQGEGESRRVLSSEAKLREMKKRCYDPATKTATFQCSVFLENLEADEPITLELTLWDRWQRGEGLDLNNYEMRGEIRRTLGSVRFSLTPQQVCSLRFAEPLAFQNEERGGSGQVLGLDISPTRIVWYIVHDEQEAAHYAVKWEGEKAQDQFALSLSWNNCIDRFLRDASLHFSDGTSSACAGSLSAQIVDGIVQVTAFHPTDPLGTEETTIDLHLLSSVTISGSTFPIPPVTEIRG